MFAMKGSRPFQYPARTVCIAVHTHERCIMNGVRGYLVPFLLIMQRATNDSQNELRGRASGHEIESKLVERSADRHA